MFFGNVISTDRVTRVLRGVSLKFFIASTFYLASFIGLLSAASAQAQNAMTETYSPLNKPKAALWSSELNLSGSRNQNPYAEPVVGAQASVYYEIFENRYVYAGGGYAQPTSQDEHRNYRYGFEDSFAGFFAKNLFRFDSGVTIDLDSDVSAPTSTVSQRASMITSVSSGFIVHYPITGRFFAISRHKGGLNFYRYDTANVAGTEYNYPWAITNSAGLGMRLMGTITTLDYELAHLKDYSGLSVNVQTLRAALSVAVEKSVLVTAFARWRDHTITNYKFLDPDTRVVGLTMTVYY